MLHTTPLPGQMLVMEGMLTKAEAESRLVGGMPLHEIKRRAGDYLLEYIAMHCIKLRTSEDGGTIEYLIRCVVMSMDDYRAAIMHAYDCGRLDKPYA